MIAIKASETITSPVTRVFDFVADFEHAPQWQSGVGQSTVMTPGPIGKGTRFSETHKLGFRSVATVLEITDYQANRLVAFQATSAGPLTCEGRFAFEPAADGTHIDLSARMTLTGVWRLLTPLLAGMIKRETRKELATLKRLIESGAAAGMTLQAGASSTPS